MQFNFTLELFKLIILIHISSEYCSLYLSLYLINSIVKTKLLKKSIYINLTKKIYYLKYLLSKLKNFIIKNM